MDRKIVLISGCCVMICRSLFKLLGYVMVVAYAVDAFFKYRNYRSATAATSEGTTQAAAESGGANK